MNHDHEAFVKEYRWFCGGAIVESVWVGFALGSYVIRRYFEAVFVPPKNSYLATPHDNVRIGNIISGML